MALPYDHSIPARAIVDLLEKQPGWKRVTSGRTPLWFWRMVSAAVLLLNGEPPQYVTGTLDDEAGTALIFGTGVVVTVDVIKPRTDDAQVRVSALSRGGLTSLEATASLAVGHDETLGSWPGSVELIATYSDGRVWKLPMVEPMDHELRERLEDFIPSILADLTVT